MALPAIPHGFLLMRHAGDCGKIFSRQFGLPDAQLMVRTRNSDEARENDQMDYASRSHLRCAERILEGGLYAEACHGLSGCSSEIPLIFRIVVSSGIYMLAGDMPGEALFVRAMQMDANANLGGRATVRCKNCGAEMPRAPRKCIKI